MKNNRNVMALLCGVISLCVTTWAKADYWDYRYIGNPLTVIQTTDPDTEFAGGKVTIDFHSSVLLAPNQTFWLGSTPSISNVVINFDYTGGLDPSISSTFSGYPTAMLDPYYSYITIGNDGDTISNWEIVKDFVPVTEPYRGSVITASYPVGWAAMKPFCVMDCSGFDRFTLDDGSVWVYDKPGTWTVTLVPEPEIYAMLGMGLGLMGFMARRRKMQAA